MSKKKFLFELLFILLFTLLLGTFGTTFAWTYNEVKGTIENVITNSGYNNGFLTNLNTWVHSEVAEEWTELYSYDNFMIMNNIETVTDNISNLNHAIIAYAWNNPETNYNLYEYKYNSTVWGLKTTTNMTRITFNGKYESNWANDEYYSTTTANNVNYFGFANRNNAPLFVIFTDKSILANANGGTATKNWNTYTRYIPMVWQYDSAAQYRVYKYPYTTGIPTYNVIDSIYQCELGTIKDSIYARKIIYNWGTWNGSSYNWGKDIVAYDFNKNGYLPNYYRGSTTTANDINSTKLYLNTNNHANDILSVTIESDNMSIRGTIITFYLITNNYSKIINGVYYPGSTFSGDYQQQYNEQQQTNTITGTINDTVNDAADKVSDTLTDNSEVQNILDDNLSGDTILNNIGFNFVVNPFENIIKNTLQATTNALLGTGNERLSFRVMNTTITLKSEDFSLPNGELKEFITIISNALVVYLICKYGFKLYNWINTGRLQNLLNEQNRHSYYLF